MRGWAGIPQLGVPSSSSSAAAGSQELGAAGSWELLQDGQGIEISCEMKASSIFYCQSNELLSLHIKREQQTRNSLPEPSCKLEFSIHCWLSVDALSSDPSTVYFSLINKAIYVLSCLHAIHEISAVSCPQSYSLQSSVSSTQNSVAKAHRACLKIKILDVFFIILETFLT